MVAYRNRNIRGSLQEHKHLNIGYSTGEMPPPPARLIGPQGGSGPCENPQRGSFQGSLFSPMVLLITARVQLGDSGWDQRGRDFVSISCQDLLRVHVRLILG